MSPSSRMVRKDVRSVYRNYGSPREPERNGLRSRRGDTKPPTVRLVGRAGGRIEKTEQIHR